MSLVGHFKLIIEKWFPDREILVRSNDSVTQVRLGRRRQLVVGAFGALTIVWTVCATGVGYYFSHRLSMREEQLFRSEMAYSELVNRVAESQKKFSEITSQMEDTHHNLLNMAEKNLKLQERVQDFSLKLADSEKEKGRISALRSSMDNQMNALGQQIDGLTNRNIALRDELETVETVMTRVMRERDQAITRSKILQGELAQAHQRITDLHTVQKQALERVAAHAGSSIADLKSVLKMTGVPIKELTGDAMTGDVKRVLDAGVGGPFIQFEPETPEDELFMNAALAVGNRMDQLASLQKVINRLPLGEPTENYYVSSNFGKRKDPFNGKWSFHSGVDLAAPMKTPIYSTAPGVVVHAGWTGGYGKMVEIDHGNGLKTRYGHLMKVLVKKGQKVKYQEVVALMGSTGRSTGSHVHYEVLLHGKQIDPIKFIKAGQYVFKIKQDTNEHK
ncbi:peptidase M23 [Thalassospira profundimaris]|uniref:Peptidase M23 n=1 Tax=Thalassospira profundimaris TaxID=502049 RepID=A0A367XFW1_9PROT|nr:M23 family metallopeptidase [Thalassospira profundimaris]RCK52564.1 peptidase M23 [Thalassospira profundimaris]